MSCAAHSLHESRLSGADLEFRGHCRLADQSGGGRDCRFGDHLDRVARALLETNGTAGAEVVVDAVKSTRTELHDRLLRTGGEAVAAGQAAARFVTGLGLGQALCDFLKPLALAGRQFRGFLTRRIEEHRKVERFKGDDRGLWRFDVSLASEEGVDVAGGLLSVTDGRGHRSRAADQIAAGEDARMSSAHGCVDFDHITAADPNTWHGLEELDVRMLANG